MRPRRQPLNDGLIRVGGAHWNGPFDDSPEVFDQHKFTNSLILYHK